MSLMQLALGVEVAGVDATVCERDATRIGIELAVDGELVLVVEHSSVPLVNEPPAGGHLEAGA